MRLVLNKRKKIRRFLLCALFLSVLLAMLYWRSDVIQKFTENWIVQTFREKLHLKVQWGGWRGYLIGKIHIRDLSVVDPDPVYGNRDFLKIQELEIQYPIWEILSKKGPSRLRLTIKKPLLYLHPHLSIKNQPMPYLDWLKQWSLSQVGRAEIKIVDATIVIPEFDIRFEKMNAKISRQNFELEWPVRHLTVGNQDLSTVIKMEGQFNPGFLKTQNQLVGKIYTEGTVLNWAPLPSELQFDLRLEDRVIWLRSIEFFGGIRMDMRYDFSDSQSLECRLEAFRYPLSRLGALMRLPSTEDLLTQVDMELHLTGSPNHPRLWARLRMDEGWLIPHNVKAMDLELDGIYPTMKIYNSRVLLKDGRSMRFMDEIVEFSDLFDQDLYQRLAVEASQESFVWGAWEFHRSQAEDLPLRQELEMRHFLGSKASVNLKPSSHDAMIQPDDVLSAKVGFSYKIQSNDVLEFELSEEESFVGLRHKKSF